MVTEKDFFTEIECFSENVEIMFCTSDYQKLYAKIPFCDSRYDIF